MNSGSEAGMETVVILEARSQRIQKTQDVYEEINRLKNFESRFQEIQKEFVR